MFHTLQTGRYPEYDDDMGKDSKDDDTVIRVDLNQAAKAFSAAASALARAISGNATNTSDSIKETIAESITGLANELNDTAIRVNGAKVSSRSDKAAETRLKIMEAAAREIAEQGYGEASMADIAARAGFTKGALYAHFASKEDLCVATVKQMLEGEDFGTDPSWVDQMLANDPPHNDRITMRLFVFEVMSFFFRHPERQDEIRPAFQDYVDRLSRSIAAQDSEEHPTGNAEDRAITLISVNNLGAAMAYLLQDDQSAHQTEARLVRESLS
jgi:AcrR family transcriptional regulator